MQFEMLRKKPVLCLKFRFYFKIAVALLENLASKKVEYRHFFLQSRYFCPALAERLAVLDLLSAALLFSGAACCPGFFFFWLQRMHIRQIGKQHFFYLTKKPALVVASFLVVFSSFRRIAGGLGSRRAFPASSACLCML
jgi:hypothetical protein